MLAVQADVDTLRNEPMWVLARSNVIDMIAELRFRKMKEIVPNAVHGNHAYWNQSETFWAMRTICGPNMLQISVV